MTKYYYKGQLVRTSKTHDNYTFGVVYERNGKVVLMMASSKLDNCITFWRYSTRGIREPNNKNLASSQYCDPEELEIVELEKVSA